MNLSYWSEAFFAASQNTSSQLPKGVEDFLKTIFGSDLIEWFNQRPTLSLWIGIAVALIIAFSALTKFTSELDKFLVFLGKYILKNEELTEKELSKLRDDLIRAELKQVTTRLDDSLHHKIRIDLQREEQRRRVGRAEPLKEKKEGILSPVIRSFKSFFSQHSRRKIDSQLSTIDLLEREDIQGRMLILGEPGSGKTNELLSTVQALLQDVENSAEKQFPVIFELSAWKLKDDQGLEDWLISQLKDKYNVSEKVSKYWIENQQLMPCLDGLDELRRVDDIGPSTSQVNDEQRQVNQIKCIRAINHYLDVYPGSSLIVCCRRKEYETLEEKGEKLKSLMSAIYLEEIANEQIEEYLISNKRDSLWSLLEDNDILLSLARKPLFLLMLVVAYQGQVVQSEDELIDLYIQKQLHDGLLKSAYPPRRKPTAEQTERYLGWLATRLEKEETTEFLIERLQPSWLEKKFEYRIYCGTYYLILGLSTGLHLYLQAALLLGLLSLTSNFNNNVNTSEMEAIWWGLKIICIILGGMIGLLLCTLSPKPNFVDIKLRETITFSWSIFRKSVVTTGLIVGFFFGLLVGFRAGLHSGIIAGTTMGLVFSFMNGWRAIISRKSIFIETETLSLTLQKSLKNRLSIGLLLGLSGGLLLSLILGWSNVLYSVPSIDQGIILGLCFGLFLIQVEGVQWLNPIIAHVILRALLWRTGHAPWNYARFLEHAENYRLIQRVGIRYRFIHNLVQKRFAQKYQAKLALSAEKKAIY